jgi:phage terminase small subunit
MSRDDGALTPKQEKFLRLYIEVGNASEAYRAAYRAKNMTAKSVHEQASRLLANRKVAARVTAWRKRAADEAVLDRAWVLKRLMRNARIAMGEEPVKLRMRSAKSDEVVEVEVSDRDAGAANKALELLGKTPELAMFIERREVGAPNQFAQMTDEELHRFIVDEAQALGIDLSGAPKANATAKH